VLEEENFMKDYRLGLTVVSGAIVMLPSIAGAANTVVFAACGSSAMFNVFRQGALVALSGTHGTNDYQANNAGFVADASDASEVGNLWVIWSGPSGSRKIALYLSVDSTVGDRSYFNSDTVNLVNPVPAPAAGYANLPADVQTTLSSGVTCNAGMTDIAPADALVATSRAMSLGYGPSNSIKGLNSSGAFTSIATPVSFSLSNRGYNLVSIGASPIMVFVNKTDTGSTGLGNTSLSDVSRFTFSYVLNGSITSTADLFLTSSSATTKPLTSFIREPLSGTYNTTEYCVPQSLEVQSSQESGVSANPLNEAGYNGLGTFTGGTSNGGRVRAIGTGALVTNANATTNSLGYAFWSFGNFSGKTNLRYLTLDGADPLFDGFGSNNGSLQPGSVPTFRNLANGGYGAWSILRIVEPASVGVDYANIVSDATASDSGGDFIAFNNLLVFRSHHATPAEPNPNNALKGTYNGTFVDETTSGTTPEAGGDVGGAVFPIQAELDSFLNFGVELVGLRQ
jgi:hypothetical protein